MDKEGRVYLFCFWCKYKDKMIDECMVMLFEGLKLSVDCLVVVYCYLLLEVFVSEFVCFMDDKLLFIMCDKFIDK